MQSRATSRAVATLHAFAAAMSPGIESVTRFGAQRRTLSRAASDERMNDHVRNRRHLRTRGKRVASIATCCQRMNESQHHRGPDECGLHVEPGVGLGHDACRSSICRPDSSRCTNEDGSVVVVYNGEIYNYQSLIPELARARPHVPHARATPRSSSMRGRHGARPASSVFAACLRSRCGTAIERRCFSRATASASSRCTTRCSPDGTFLFGSELKSLLTHPGLRRDIDPLCRRGVFRTGLCAGTADDLRRGAQAPAGAHAAAIGAAQALPEPTRYWDPRFTLDRLIASEDAMAELVARFASRSACA